MTLTLVSGPAGAFPLPFPLVRWPFPFPFPLAWPLVGNGSGLVFKRPFAGLAFPPAPLLALVGTAFAKMTGPLSYFWSLTVALNRHMDLISDLYHSCIITEGRVSARTDTSSIGERVRAVRVRRFLTQDQLAASAGVGRATIARIEVGEGHPRMKTISALAMALSVDPNELVPDPESVWPRRKSA